MDWNLTVNSVLRYLSVFPAFTDCPCGQDRSTITCHLSDPDLGHVNIKEQWKSDIGAKSKGPELSLVAFLYQYSGRYDQHKHLQFYDLL